MNSQNLLGTRRLWLALGITLLLRLPAFAWPAISDDEGIYDALAQGILAGGVMYRDVVDHKPPGLAYTYATVESLAGATQAGPRGMAAVHALGAAAAVLTAWGLYLIARELLLPSQAFWPALLFGIASTAKCAYDGLAVNGELLMGVPTVFAVWAVVRAHRASAPARWCLDVAAGALMGVAGLYKWQALLTGLAFPFFAGGGVQAFVRRVWTRGAAWLVGLTLPMLATAAFFHAHGVLSDALAWGLRFNAQYVAEGPRLVWALQRLAVQLAAVVLPSALLYLCAAYGVSERMRRRLDGATLGLVCWLVVALLSVSIGGRFFGHYFLQLELPLCLLATAPVASLFARVPRRVVLALAIPALMFAGLALTPRGTRALLDASDPHWDAVGHAIEERTQPRDALFVWGNAPLIYHHAQRLMGTRFAFCNYLTGLSPGTPSEYDTAVQPDASGSAAWPALLADLGEKRPAFLLDTAAAGWKGYGKFPLAHYPALNDYVQQHYRYHSTIAGAVLYERAD